MRCYMLDTHLLDGIVTITATSFQRVDGQLVLRELSDDYIVIGCQIPTFDKILGRWRAYKTLKQHTERLPLHTARRCRHSQLQCIPVAVKQVFVRACQGMMSFVHHNHPRYAIRLFQIPDMPAEPLNREHTDSLVPFLSPHSPGRICPVSAASALPVHGGVQQSTPHPSRSYPETISPPMPSRRSFPYP